jgi:hypothetical protein
LESWDADPTHVKAINKVKTGMLALHEELAEIKCHAAAVPHLGMRVSSLSILSARSETGGVCPTQQNPKITTARSSSSVAHVSIYVK